MVDVVASSIFFLYFPGQICHKEPLHYNIGDKVLLAVGHCNNEEYQDSRFVGHTASLFLSLAGSVQFFLNRQGIPAYNQYVLNLAVLL